jgi:hypothetical protein
VALSFRSDTLLWDIERGVAGCPALTLSVVEGASHLFEEPGTLEEALNRTVDWFKSTLQATSASSAKAGQG